MAVTARLTGLHVYPVKSCRGIPLGEARLTAHGLEHDREWMVVDETGKFVTQRSHPSMALIATDLTSTSLWLRAPQTGPLEVSLTRRGQGGLPVEIWGHRTVALDEGDAAAAWFGDFLGARLRLVRWHPERRRLSSPEWTGGADAENHFSDGFPYHGLSEESLADLNARLGSPGALPMNRFRPNLVLAGVAPYAEDHLRTLRAEGLELRIVKPCERCGIPGIEQTTAALTGQEPLRTLAGYRRDPRFSAPVFGQNMILTVGVGVWLKVGTELVGE